MAVSQSKVDFALGHDANALSGACLADVSIAVVQLYRRFYGRGPSRARTTAQDNVVTTVLEEIFTTIERTLIDSGEVDLVTAVRTTSQAAIAGELIAEVERLTGRTVKSTSSDIDVERAMATETFVLEAPAASKRA